MAGNKNNAQNEGTCLSVQCCIIQQPELDEEVIFLLLRVTVFKRPLLVFN